MNPAYICSRSRAGVGDPNPAAKTYVSCDTELDDVFRRRPPQPPHNASIPISPSSSFLQHREQFLQLGFCVARRVSNISQTTFTEFPLLPAPGFYVPGHRIVKRPASQYYRHNDSLLQPCKSNYLCCDHCWHLYVLCSVQETGCTHLRWKI